MRVAIVLFGMFATTSATPASPARLLATPARVTAGAAISRSSLDAPAGREEAPRARRSIERSSIDPAVTRRVLGTRLRGSTASVLDDPERDRIARILDAQGSARRPFRPRVMVNVFAAWTGGGGGLTLQVRR